MLSAGSGDTYHEHGFLGECRIGGCFRRSFIRGILWYPPDTAERFACDRMYGRALIASKHYLFPGRFGYGQAYLPAHSTFPADSRTLSFKQKNSLAGGFGPDGVSLLPDSQMAGFVCQHDIFGRSGDAECG